MMEKKKEQLSTGRTAPDFTLKDQNSADFRLSEAGVKRVLLSFHPMAWTSVCAKQMQSLEQNRDRFESMNTLPLGISIDTIPSKKAWADSLGIRNTALLSDFWPHGKVAKDYGIFRDQHGTSERANIIVDDNGKIIFTRIYEISQLPDIEEIIRFIQDI